LGFGGTVNLWLSQRDQMDGLRISSRFRPHAGIRRTGSGAFMDWRGGGFSAYDLVQGVIAAKATA
jgi:hypothetical protein